MELVRNLFERGGVIMWPLLGCSVISLTITLERLMFWWRERWRYDQDRIMQLFGLAERGDFDKVPAERTRRLDWALRVLHAGLKQRDHGLTEAMQVEADSAVEAMKQGLGVLDTIVTMAPLLGILGTVLGIIDSFDLLGASGIEDPKAVTGGIAQALITTAAGLAIALVTLVPLNYFIGRTERAVRRLQQIATHFEVAYRRGQGRGN